MPVETETFRELWAPLVHTNFGGNSYGPIIGPQLFLGKFVWTNGPESSSKVSPYTGIGPWTMDVYLGTENSAQSYSHRSFWKSLRFVDVRDVGSWISALKCLFFQDFECPDRSFGPGDPRKLPPDVRGISVPKTSSLGWYFVLDYSQVRVIQLAPPPPKNRGRKKHIKKKHINN